MRQSPLATWVPLDDGAVCRMVYISLSHFNVAAHGPRRSEIKFERGSWIVNKLSCTVPRPLFRRFIVNICNYDHYMNLNTSMHIMPERCLVSRVYEANLPVW